MSVLPHPKFYGQRQKKRFELKIVFHIIIAPRAHSLSISELLIPKYFEII